MSSTSGSKFLQYFAAMTGNLSIMAAAAMMGWASPVLKKLTQNDPIADDNPLGYAITAEEGSWISSIVSIGSVTGCFIFGYLAKRWGRRKTLLFSIIPSTISWIMIATAKNLGQLYVARFVAGLGMGAAFAILPMYTVEIAETSIRGALGSFMQLFMNFGWLWSYCIGPYVSYTALWIACESLQIFFFISYYFMPESPYYLSAQGKKYEVITVLSKLRGKSREAVQAEADEIQLSIEEASKSNTSIKDLFRVQSNFKALSFICVLFTFQSFSGALCVLNYAEIIFTAAGTTGSVSTAVSTIIIGIVQLVASSTTPLLVDRLGRKALLIFSGIGETISLIALGLYFYLMENPDAFNGNGINIDWLPVTSLMVFIGTYSVGWGPLPWTIMGELFVSDIKTKAFGFATLTLGVLAFIVTKFFTNIVDAFGMHSTFWIFAGFCFFSVVFTIFWLPETKGKSLQEIQVELGSNTRINKILPTTRY